MEAEASLASAAGNELMGNLTYGLHISGPILGDIA